MRGVGKRRSRYIVFLPWGWGCCLCGWRVVSSALLGVVWKVLGVIGGDGVVGARRGLWVVGAGCGVWCRLLGRRWWRDSLGAFTPDALR